MPTGTTGAPLANESTDAPLLDESTDAPIINEGNTLFGAPIPDGEASGGALADEANDAALLDEANDAPLIDEGLGILAGRITILLDAGIQTQRAQDFTLHSGNSAELRVTLTDVDGTAANASQWILTWTCGRLGAAPAITKSSTSLSEIQIAGINHNYAQIFLTAADTVLSSGSDTGVLYQHELKIRTIDNQNVTGMTGVFTLIRSLA